METESDVKINVVCDTKYYIVNTYNEYTFKELEIYEFEHKLILN